MVAELEGSQNAFAAPLLETTKRLTALIGGGTSDLAALKLLLSAARYACRIFFSLNSPGLTPVRICKAALCLLIHVIHDEFVWMQFPSLPFLGLPS